MYFENRLVDMQSRLKNDIEDIKYSCSINDYKGNKKDTNINNLADFHSLDGSLEGIIYYTILYYTIIYYTILIFIL